MDVDLNVMADGGTKLWYIQHPSLVDDLSLLHQLHRTRH